MIHNSKVENKVLGSYNIQSFILSFLHSFLIFHHQSFH
jgi:hypothetical protein